MVVETSVVVPIKRAVSPFPCRLAYCRASDSDSPVQITYSYRAWANDDYQADKARLTVGTACGCSPSDASSQPVNTA